MEQALRSVIEIDGAAALSSPSRLANALSDLLPDSPRDVSLLVTAAEVDVAGLLAGRAADGVEVDAAIGMAVERLLDARHVSEPAGRWVVARMAEALGLAAVPADLDATAPSPAPPSPPAPPPPSPSAATATAAAAAAPPPVPPTLPATAAEPAVVTDVEPAPLPPAAAPKRRRRLGLLAIPALVVAAYLAVAAAAGVVPFSSSGTPSSTAPRASTPGPTPASNLEALRTLVALLPDQRGTDPAGNVVVDPAHCTSMTTPAGSSIGGVRGEVASVTCRIPGKPSSWSLTGVLFGSHADYLTGAVHQIHDYSSGSDLSHIAHQCPPPTGASAGLVPWSSPTWPAGPGQDLYCVMDGDEPVYTWVVPTAQALFAVRGGSTATFADLQQFWALDGTPLGP